MLRTVQVLAVILVAVAAALPLAHALELPGKLRLGKAAYLAMQPIYYPGFTIGAGIGEGGGMLVLVFLLLLTPRATTSFRWTLAALALLIVMHAIYWVVTHPVNNFWIRDVRMGAVGGKFFSLFSAAEMPEADWMKLRDRWEYSHAARAIFGVLSLLAIAAAVTTDRVKAPL